MKYTPSFSTALAKLGLLIPICVAGHTLSSIDLSPTPQAEVFWTLDGDEKSYCSEHLQQALKHCPQPQASKKALRKRNRANKENIPLVSNAEPKENAPILCQGAAVYASEPVRQGPNAATGGANKATICHTLAPCSSSVPELAEASHDEERFLVWGDPKQPSCMTRAQTSAQSKDTVIAIESDVKLNQVPELLCKPCKLIPKIASEPQQAPHVQRSFCAQDTEPDSAWNELIPSFANEACKPTTQDISYNDTFIVAEQDPSFPLRHLPHEPEFGHSIPTFVRESNYHVEHSSKNQDSLCVREDQSSQRFDIVHRPSFDQLVPQFVVHGEEAHRPNISGASSCDTTLSTAAAHADVAHSPDFEAEIPHFANERCESSGRIQTASKAWFPQDPTASSTITNHTVNYERQVPRFANEGSDQIGLGPTQCLTGTLQQHSTPVKETAHQPSFQQSIPAFASEGCFTPSTTFASEERIAIQEHSSTFPSEKVHQTSDQREIPHLIQDSCITSPGHGLDRSTPPFAPQSPQHQVRSVDAVHAPTFEQAIPACVKNGEEGSIHLLPAAHRVSKTESGRHSNAPIAHQPSESGEIPSLARGSWIDSTRAHPVSDVVSQGDGYSTYISHAPHTPADTNRSVPACVQDSCYATQRNEEKVRQPDTTLGNLGDKGSVPAPRFKPQIPLFETQIPVAATKIEDHSPFVVCAEGVARAPGSSESIAAEVSHTASNQTGVPTFACTSSTEPHAISILSPTSVPERAAAVANSTSRQVVSSTEIPHLVQHSCLASQCSNDEPRTTENIAIGDGENQSSIARQKTQQKQAVATQVAYCSLFGAIVPASLYEGTCSPSPAVPLTTAQHKTHSPRFSEEIPPLAHSNNGFNAPKLSGPCDAGQNACLTDTSAVRPKVSENSVPRILDQGHQRFHSPDLSAEQPTAESKYPSSCTVLSHDFADASIPNMLNESCQPSIAAQPQTRRADSEYAATNSRFQGPQSVVAAVPQILSECCDDSMTAMPRGYQGSIKGGSASSEDALLRSDLDACIPSLLTQSCSDTPAQPLSIQNSAESYPSARGQEQRTTSKNGVPELLREYCIQNASVESKTPRCVEGSFATTHSDIQRFDTIKSGVPEFVSESCDRNATTLANPRQGSANDRFATSHTEFMRAEVVPNNIPELLGEGCDGCTIAKPQTHTVASTDPSASSHTQITHSEIDKGGVPELLGEGCDGCTIAKPQTHAVASTDPFASSHTEITHSDIVKGWVPELLSEGCERGSQAQPQAQQVRANSPFATVNSEIQHSDIARSWVPDFVCESSDRESSSLAFTPSNGPYTRESGAKEVSHIAELNKHPMPAHQDCIDDGVTRTGHDHIPQQVYLSAASPTISHLLNMLSAVPSSDHGMAKNRSMEECEASPFITESPLEPSDIARETDVVLAEQDSGAPDPTAAETAYEETYFPQAEPETEASLTIADDPEMDALNQRLEDLLADIRILQDQQQMAERDEAPQSHYAQLFSLPVGAIASEDQPRQDLAKESLANEKSKFRAQPTSTAKDIWAIEESRTARTQTTPQIPVYPTPTSQPWQDSVLDSLAEGSVTQVAHGSKNAWCAVSSESDEPAAHLSCAQFSKESTEKKNRDSTPSLSKEWQVLQLSEKPSDGVVLSELQPDPNSDWTIIEPPHEMVRSATLDAPLTPYVNSSAMIESPWTSWETSPSMTIKLTEASFQPATLDPLVAEEPNPLWSQWNVAEPTPQEPIWTTWEDPKFDVPELSALTSTEVSNPSDYQEPILTPLVDLLTEKFSIAEELPSLFTTDQPAQNTPILTLEECEDLLTTDSPNPCKEQVSLFATPTELPIPLPPPPYLGGNTEELLEAIAQIRDEEFRAQRRVAMNIQAPNELGGRKPLVIAGPRFPALKSHLADKIAGFSSVEDESEERASDHPLRSGIVQSPPGIGKNPKTVRTQFIPTTLEDDPSNSAPKVNFKPAGITTICEDESFCYTGIPRITPLLPPQRNQSQLGPRNKNTAENESKPTSSSSSFGIKIEPKPGAARQNRSPDAAGVRSSRGPLTMLRKVIDFFLPKAYASEPCDSNNSFQSIGAPTFGDQESSITVLDDESWWYDPIPSETNLAIDEDHDHLVVGARDHSPPADESRTGHVISHTSAGIDSPGYKPFSLGVNRQGHLWSQYPQAPSEEPLVPQWEKQDQFTSITLVPEEPDPKYYELEEYTLSELHPPVQKKNYDWNLDGVNKSLFSETQEFDPPVANIAENADWTDRTPEAEKPRVRVAVESLANPKAMTVEAPADTPALLTAPAPKPMPQLDPLTPSRDLKLNRTIAEESLSPKLIAQPQETSSSSLAPLPPAGFTLNFPNVNIKEYIRFVSRETKKNFIYNEDELDFNATIVSAVPTEPENMMAALLQELRIHGFSLIDQGNTLIIHRSGANSPAKMWIDGIHGAEADVVTRIFPLKHVPLNEMAPVVKQMLSDKATVQVIPETKSLIVTDLAENVARLSTLVDNLDIPAKTFELGQYVAINNFIENLVPLAEQILRPLAGDDNLTFVPHLATNSVFIIAPAVLVKRAISVMEHLDHLEGQTQILTLDKLVPVGGEGLPGKAPSGSTERKQPSTVRRRPFDLSPENLLRSDAGHLDIENEVNPNEDIHAPLRDLGIPSPYPFASPRAPEKSPEQITIEELDNTKFYIHRLQYRKGDQLVDALSRIAESLRYNEKANIDLINAITSTQWIESSNSIMVTGTQLALDRVKQLILEIDVPLRQILLEMLIIETTVSDGLNFSVDWGSEFADDHAAGAQAWQSGTSGLLKLPTATTTVGQVTIPTLGQQGFQLGVIGRRILLGNMYFSSLGFLVNALHSVTNVDIKLNPKIVVEDNTPAELFVGQNTAFLSQAITNQLGNVIANNVEFRDVGTRLSVTPQIGNGNMITLVIALEDSKDVSSSTGGSSGGGIGPSGNTINPGPTTSTTRTTTKIHVPNKFFVILSGMIREETTVVQQNLPCLGGIPILAGFAKSERTSVGKRNLMVFIRPQIIETEWEYDDVTRRQQNIYRMNSEDKKPPWQYEVDKALEFFHLPRFNDKECSVPDVNDENCGCCPFWADPLWD